jgi:hypothetical protein
MIITELLRLMSVNVLCLLLDTLNVPNVSNCYLYAVPYSYVMRSFMLRFTYFFISKYLHI